MVAIIVVVITEYQYEYCDLLPNASYHALEQYVAELSPQIFYHTSPVASCRRHTWKMQRDTLIELHN